MSGTHDPGRAVRVMPVEREAAMASPAYCEVADAHVALDRGLAKSYDSRRTRSRSGHRRPGLRLHGGFGG